jgi:hypothetical protein
MRLHSRLVSYIAETVVAELQQNRRIRLQDPRPIVTMVEHLIEDDLEAEAELDDEAREVLADHYQEMREGGVNYDEMFRKVKAKLAHEKGIKL